MVGQQPSRKFSTERLIIITKLFGEHGIRKGGVGYLSAMTLVFEPVCPSLLRDVLAKETTLVVCGLGNFLLGSR